MSRRRGAAVLGSPIAHSLSPVLHHAAYGALGLTDWSYRAIECTEAELPAMLTELSDKGLAGVSLTMPLKRAVMPLLASVDERAALVGGANTVLFDADGWRGANTDVPGMVAALGEAGNVGRAVVLGAGATAAAALAALAECAVGSVQVIARRAEAAAGLAPLAAAVGLDFTAGSWDELTVAAAAPLVISTTPAGSSDALAAAVTTPAGVLFDVIYSPWPTPLADAWQAAGGQVIGGLELLVEQAALQVRMMTGLEPPVSAMREAGYAALGR